MKAKLGLTAGLFGVLAGSSASAQTRFIWGKAVDSVTSEPMRAGVVEMLGTKLRAPIREDGTFVIYAPIREVTVAIKGVGFRPKEVVVPVTTDALVVPMHRDYFELEAVVVTGQA